MTLQVDLRIVELMAARLCHDLISPVAAINNGVELLTDEEPEFLADAVKLVGEASAKATRRLQFYRFAYGFSGSGIAGPAPHQLVGEYFAGTKVACDYGEGVRALSPSWQKLACNLAAIGGDGLPRGGRLMLGASTPGLNIEGTGQGAALSPETCDGLLLKTPVGELTARSVGAYFAGKARYFPVVGDLFGSRPGNN